MLACNSHKTTGRARNTIIKGRGDRQSSCSGLRLPAHPGVLAGGPDVLAQRLQRAQQAHYVGQRACAGLVGRRAGLGSVARRGTEVGGRHAISAGRPQLNALPPLASTSREAADLAQVNEK